ncbi:30S ribosomal protein S13 [Candidatus Roizmanbacteria bacterium]|nr:30S ribosomal protein S13 [Candidatus Roizmanbacteria bacterium]
MVRLLGVNLPDDRKVAYALTLLYGIGQKSSSTILANIGIDRQKQVNQLSEDELKKISSYIEKNFKIEGDLREDITDHIKRLREIGTYRGLRHVRGLPVRGQRTRSNARTKRGKRKTVGALKKEAWAKLGQQQQREQVKPRS